MQLNKNFEINPELTDVLMFLHELSHMDGWDITWHTICDARGKVRHYAVNSPVSSVVYEIYNLDDCLSMVMNDVKWLAECLDYGYVKEVKDADV